jgi:Na+/proline symporter
MNDLNQIFSGIWLITGMNIVIFILSGIVSSIVNNNVGTVYLYAMLGIGITQLLYVIPLVIRLKRQRKWGLIKGVIIGAALTILFNVALLIWMVYNFQFD